MSKVLVAYFSASGVTAAIAAQLAKAADAALYEIKPAVPYTDPDLNWVDKSSRSSVEMNNLSIRPEIKDTDAPVAEADTVFLGFPIWWHIAPTIVNTFLEAYDFSGKKIVLFATSGGSKFSNTAENLACSVSADTVIIEGRLFNGRVSAADLKEFAQIYK